MPITNRMLNVKEVSELTGLGRSKIYPAMATDDFPKSVQLGRRAVRWHEEEIRNWLAQRPRYGE
jgi:prophage regulatory protein